ncbi:hypothetical protein CYMTET_33268 [Cymbomonas tetramitiformis]|uniref:Uncharacterized protein n=1 Tax=Cymbomonas tetramitiformis TaxID=36881 RepID=A0AAE0KR47_9CHLO|nr:hypothetical protein CYMTET_33268 [Cymbomonas tetramitiformis]
MTTAQKAATSDEQFLLAAEWVDEVLGNELGRGCLLNATALEDSDAESYRTLCSAGLRCAPCVSETGGTPPPDTSSDSGVLNAWDFSTGGVSAPATPPTPGFCSAGFDGQCVPCELGDFCPQGSINPYYWTKYNVCPSGSICVNATSKQPCKAGWFCPEATFAYLPELECTAEGSYCPESSSRPDNPCPAGWYCPSPAFLLECPAGKYCRKFSSTGTSCPPFSRCPEGSQSPQAAYPTIVIIVCGFFLANMVLQAITFRREKVHNTVKRGVLKAQRIVDGRTKLLEQLMGVEQNMLAVEIPGLKSTFDPINITFRKLTVTIPRPTGDLRVLKEVTGQLNSKAITAVMGPSGCGKTTLLTMLAGRMQQHATMQGEIDVNSDEDALATYREGIGFVPQDNTVFGELTVMENLYYSARLRLTKEEQPRLYEILVGVLQVLTLQSVANHPVGTTEKRGVSGGQKRRVNIGMELVTNPPVLFLDEPTSGLGAAATLVIMKALRSLAQMNRTVAAVIHQPRSEVFDLFDYALFLGSGGYGTFFGPTTFTKAYFQCLGFHVIPGVSPADFFMDVLAGHVQRSGDPAFTTADLPGLWESFSDMAIDEQLAFLEPKLPKIELSAAERDFMNTDHYARMMQRIKEQWREIDSNGDSKIEFSEFSKFLNIRCGMRLDKNELEYLFQMLDTDGDATISMNEFLAFTEQEIVKVTKTVQTKSLRVRGLRSMHVKRSTTTTSAVVTRSGLAFVWQLWVILCRCGTQRLRLSGLWALDSLLVMLGALVIGLVVGSDWEYRDIQTNAWLSAVSLGILTCISSLRVFGAEHTMRVREARCGVQPIAYLLAKFMWDIPEMTLRATLFVAMYYSLVLPEEPFRRLLFEQCASCFSCSGLGMLISVICPPDAAQLPGVLTPLITGVFLSGVDPSLSDMSPFLKGATQISFTRWATEAVTLSETDEMPEHLKILREEYLEGVGYDLDNHDTDILALILMGLMFRALTCVVVATPRAVTEHIRSHLAIASQIWASRPRLRVQPDNAAEFGTLETGKFSRASFKAKVDKRRAPLKTFCDQDQLDAPSAAEPPKQTPQALDAGTSGPRSTAGDSEVDSQGAPHPLVGSPMGPEAADATSANAVPANGGQWRSSQLRVMHAAVNSNGRFAALVNEMGDALGKRRQQVLQMMARAFLDDCTEADASSSGERAEASKATKANIEYAVKVHRAVRRELEAKSSDSSIGWLCAALLLPLDLMERPARSAQSLHMNQLICVLSSCPIHGERQFDEGKMRGVIKGVQMVTMKIDQLDDTCVWKVMGAFAKYIKSVCDGGDVEVTEARNFLTSTLLGM